MHHVHEAAQYNPQAIVSHVSRGRIDRNHHRGLRRAQSSRTETAQRSQGRYDIVWSIPLIALPVRSQHRLNVEESFNRDAIPAMT